MLIKNQSFRKKDLGVMSKLISAIFLLFFAISFSQNEGVNRLEEIVLKGSFSPKLNSGYNLETISDSILKNNNESLGDLLQKQANVFFKENGHGMVSSIALRGTNASQTGVYWNGIAINSSLNGQTDFNTLSASGFDEVAIRKGGASVLLGSGAIGGAINLSDKIIFQKKKEANVLLSLGSYQTYSSQITAALSNESIFSKFSIGGAISENDYPFLGSDLKNENGQYKNYNINGVFALKINALNSLSYYTSFVDNDRNTPRTITAPSNSKLLNFDTRNLIDWKYLGSTYTSSLKLAYLTEDFTYFFDKADENVSKGKSNRWISKYDFTYFLNKTIILNAGLEYSNEQGRGSNLPASNQNIFNAYGLFQHQPFDNWTYNLSMRKGVSSVFDIPFIYAIDTRFSITDELALKAAFSTNYRNPTFNDLYWEPGGNPDLKAEKSKSAELSIDYKHRFVQLDMTTYYIKSKDLIQWQPIDNFIWQPQNVQDVSNYGFEISAMAERKFNKHALSLKLQYDYTVSQDAATDKQLIYVPYHKSNALINYRYNNWHIAYNLQYTGKVYTTTSNTQSINSYLLSNVDIYRNLFKNKVLLAFKINNLFDKSYQSVAYRPMPNRNYTFNIHFKI